MMVSLCLCAPAGAQEYCAELAQLFAEADGALNKTADLAGQDRCYGYVHYSVAWAEIASYARKHRESCGVSAASLTDIDKRHRESVEQRVDACGGLRTSPRPKGERRLFPPEIRPH